MSSVRCCFITPWYFTRASWLLLRAEACVYPAYSAVCLVYQPAVRFGVGGPFSCTEWVGLFGDAMQWGSKEISMCVSVQGRGAPRTMLLDDRLGYPGDAV